MPKQQIPGCLCCGPPGVSGCGCTSTPTTLNVAAGGTPQTLFLGGTFTYIGLSGGFRTWARTPYFYAPNGYWIRLTIYCSGGNYALAWSNRPRSTDTFDAVGAPVFAWVPSTSGNSCSPFAMLIGGGTSPPLGPNPVGATYTATG